MTQNDQAQLPDPAQYPDADVVIYDGKCIFCIGQVKRLLWFDGKHRIAFLSLHDERARELCPDLSHDEMMEQMFVVTRAGARYGGAAAIRYLSCRLPKLWFAAPFLHIPFSLPLWQWLYLKFAERRYRISGKLDECEGGTCDLHFGKSTEAEEAATK